MELTSEQLAQREEIKKEGNRRTISGYLAIICFIVPLIVWPFLTQRFFYSKMLVLYASAVLMIVFLLALKLLPSKKIFLEPAVISVLFFLAYTTATLFTSINISLSLNGLHERKETYFIIVIYIFFYLVAASQYSYRKWHVVLFAVMISIICVYAIFQLFGIELLDATGLFTYKITESWHYIAFSTMGNPNFLASMLACALPILVYAFIRTGNYLWAIPMALDYFILLATNTRGSWIGAFIAFVVLIIFSLKQKIRWKLVIICCVILAVLTVLYALFFSSFLSRFFSAFTDIATVVTAESEMETATAGSYRIGIWKGVWMLIMKKPWTGYGIETLGQAIMNDNEVVLYLRSISPHIVFTNKAHCEFLNICVSSGIPAGIAYLSICIFTLIKGFMNIKKNMLILPLTTAVLAYFIQGMLNISNNGIAFIYYILMGILLCMCNKEDTDLHKGYIIMSTPKTYTDMPSGNTDEKSDING
ncbi:MAG: O-antigen ligase family protein [Clostridia bacterium]